MLVTPVSLDSAATAQPVTATEPAEPTLFDRLGGIAAVQAAVEVLYTRLLADPELEHFFADVSLTRLKQHQVKFMKVAFSVIPEDMDVPNHIAKVHRRLIEEKGLNATHFDLVAGHFVAALQELNVSKTLIDDAVAVIAPLRSVFDQPAEKDVVAKVGMTEHHQHTETSHVYDGNGTAKKTTLFMRLGGGAAVKALVEEFYKRLLADEYTKVFFESVSMGHLKKHQVEFFKIAFTQIPEDLDVPALLTEKHMKLFLEKGLNESHFDKVAEHFVGASQHLGVSPELIEEAVHVIGPLRSVFEEGAKLYGTKE